MIAPARTHAPRSTPARALHSALLLAMAVGLTGCVERDMGDLQAYSKEVLSRKARPIQDLPPPEVYEVYGYTSAEGVDPFEPFYKEVPPPPPGAVAASATGIQPNFDRNKEELENYALDSLRMMGTLELNEELWGIIRSPDGTIHRVQVGNYVGRNHGKIVGISEESIDLNEIIQDGRGGWQERDAALALTEQ